MEKNNIDIDTIVCSKENRDLCYTIIGKKHLNGICIDLPKHSKR